MAVPTVWRLINLLAFIEPKQHACAPLPKPKSKLLLILAGSKGYIEPSANNIIKEALTVKIHIIKKRSA